MPSIKTVALAAAFAGSALAQSWSALDCSPSYEEYVCDDDNGGEYTTTYTVYSSGCPGYTSWSDFPEEATSTTPVIAWETASVDPKPTWSAVDPKPTWSAVDPPKSTWAPIDPKPTWSSWETVDPKPTWSSWETVDPSTWSELPKTTDPAKWDGWTEEGPVIITITEIYSVPCETGWKTETAYITTEWCGCTETPKPKHPEYTTYTTECPESWGVGATVTVTIPVEPATTWSILTSTPVEPASTWSVLTSTPVDATSTSTWAEYSVSATSVADASTWGLITSTVATPVAATSTGAWAAVATFTGDASSASVSKAMVLVAGALAGVALYL